MVIVLKTRPEVRMQSSFLRKPEFYWLLELEGKRKKRNEGLIFFFLGISISNLPPKCKKILRLFRLRQLNNGVFVKVNKATVNMLQAVLPYITYG